MIFQAVLGVMFSFIIWLISWIPVISLPWLITFDFSGLWTALAVARFLLPVEAYVVVLAMWGFVFTSRLAMVPIRWLVAWFGR